MRIHCISREASTWSRPTTGMLFSAWQAATQAPQPVQVLRLITMPQGVASSLFVARLRGRLVDQAWSALAILFVDLREIGVRAVCLHVGNPDRLAAFRTKVMLRGRQAVAP